MAFLLINGIHKILIIVLVRKVNMIAMPLIKSGSTVAVYSVRKATH